MTEVYKLKKEYHNAEKTNKGFNNNFKIGGEEYPEYIFVGDKREKDDILNHDIAGDGAIFLVDEKSKKAFLEQTILKYYDSLNVETI